MGMINQWNSCVSLPLNRLLTVFYIKHRYNESFRVISQLLDELTNFGQLDREAQKTLLLQSSNIIRQHTELIELCESFDDYDELKRKYYELKILSGVLIASV